MAKKVVLEGSDWLRHFIFLIKPRDLHLIFSFALQPFMGKELAIFGV